MAITNNNVTYDKIVSSAVGHNPDSVLSAIASGKQIEEKEETTEEKASRLLNERETSKQTLKDQYKSTGFSNQTLDTKETSQETTPVEVSSLEDIEEVGSVETSQPVKKSFMDVVEATEAKAEEDENRPGAVGTVLENVGAGVLQGVDSLAHPGLTAQTIYDAARVDLADMKSDKAKFEFSVIIDKMEKNGTTLYKGRDLNQWKNELQNKYDKAVATSEEYNEEGAKDAAELASKTILGEKAQEFIEKTDEDTANLGKVGQFFAEMGRSAGFMLPSMVVGGAAGAAAGAAGASAAAISSAQSAAGLSTMFVNVYNRTLADEVSQGYDWKDAQGKALGDAIVEIGTELFVGGTPGLGLGLFDNVTSDLAENAATAAVAKGAKASVEQLSKRFGFIIDAVGEGVEEMASEVLTPFVDRVTIDPNASDATIGSVLKAGLSGALLAVFLDGSSKAIEAATAKGKQLIQNDDGTVSSVDNPGLTAEQLADKNLEVVVTQINAALQYGLATDSSAFLGEQMDDVSLGLSLENRPPMLKYVQGVTTAQDVVDYVNNVAMPAIQKDVQDQVNTQKGVEFTQRITDLIPIDITVKSTDILDIPESMVSQLVKSDSSLAGKTGEELKQAIADKVNSDIQTQGTNFKWSDEIQKYPVDSMAIYERVKTAGNAQAAYGDDIFDLENSYNSRSDIASGNTTVAINDNGVVSNLTFAQFAEKYMPNEDLTKLSVQQKKALIDAYSNLLEYPKSMERLVVQNYAKEAAKFGINIRQMTPHEVAAYAAKLGEFSPAVALGGGKVILLDPSQVTNPEITGWILAHEIGHYIQGQGNREQLHTAILDMSEELGIDFEDLQENVQEGYKDISAEDLRDETDCMFLSLLFGDTQRLTELATLDGGAAEGLNILIDGMQSKYADMSNFSRDAQTVSDRFYQAIHNANVAKESADVMAEDPNLSGVTETTARTVEEAAKKSATKKTKKESTKEEKVEQTFTAKETKKEEPVKETNKKKSTKKAAEVFTPKADTIDADIEESPVLEPEVSEDEYVSPLGTDDEAKMKWRDVTAGEYAQYGDEAAEGVGEYAGRIFVRNKDTHVVLNEMPATDDNWAGLGLGKKAKKTTTKKKAKEPSVDDVITQKDDVVVAEPVTEEEKKVESSAIKFMTGVDKADKAMRSLQDTMSVNSTYGHWLQKMFARIDDVIGYSNYKLMPKNSLARNELNLFRLWESGYLTPAGDVVDVVPNPLYNKEKSNNKVDSTILIPSSTKNENELAELLGCSVEDVKRFYQQVYEVTTEWDETFNALNISGRLALYYEQAFNPEVSTYQKRDLTYVTKRAYDAYNNFPESARYLIGSIFDTLPENIDEAVAEDVTQSVSDAATAKALTPEQEKARKAEAKARLEKMKADKDQAAKVLAAKRTAALQEIKKIAESSAKIANGRSNKIVQQEQLEPLNRDVSKAPKVKEKDWKSATNSNARGDNTKRWAYYIQGQGIDPITGDKFWKKDSKIWVAQLEEGTTPKGNITFKHKPIGYYTGTDANLERLTGEADDFTRAYTIYSKPFEVSLEASPAEKEGAKQTDLTNEVFGIEAEAKTRLEMMDETMQGYINTLSENGAEVSYDFSDDKCVLSFPDNVDVYNDKEVVDAYKALGFHGETYLVTNETGNVVTNAETGEQEPEVNQIRIRTNRVVQNNGFHGSEVFFYLTGYTSDADAVTSTKYQKVNERIKKEAEAAAEKKHADVQSTTVTKSPLDIKGLTMYRFVKDGKTYVVFNSSSKSHLRSYALNRLHAAFDTFGLKKSKFYGSLYINAYGIKYKDFVASDPNALNMYGFELKNSEASDVYEKTVTGDKEFVDQVKRSAKWKDDVTEDLVWYDYLDQKGKYAAKWALMPSTLTSPERLVIDLSRIPDKRIKSKMRDMLVAGPGGDVTNPWMTWNSDLRLWEVVHKPLQSDIRFLTKFGELAGKQYDLDYFRSHAIRDNVTAEDIMDAMATGADQEDIDRAIAAYEAEFIDTNADDYNGFTVDTGHGVIEINSVADIERIRDAGANPETYEKLQNRGVVPADVSWEELMDDIQKVLFKDYKPITYTGGNNREYKYTKISAAHDYSEWVKKPNIALTEGLVKMMRTQIQKAKSRQLEAIRSGNHALENYKSSKEEQAAIRRAAEQHAREQSSPVTVSKMTPEEIAEKNRLWNLRRYSSAADTARQKVADNLNAAEEQAFTPEDEARINQVFDEMLGTYGEQSPGGAPKSVDGKTKVSQSMDSVLLQKDLTDQTRTVIKQTILTNPAASYKTLTNDAALDSAEYALKKQYAKKNERTGLNEIGANELLQASEDFIKNNRYNSTQDAKAVAKIAALLHGWTDIAKTRDLNKAECAELQKLYAELALMSEDLGRGLQAFRMVYKSTPSGREYYTIRTVEKVTQALAEEYRGKKHFGKFTEYADKIENFSQSKQFQDLLAKLRAANTQAQVDAVETEIAKAIAANIPATIQSRVTAWRYLSMLGNLRTHARNMASNVIMDTAVGAKDTMKGILEDVFIGKKGERTTSFSARPTKEVIEFAKNDAKNMKKLLQSGGKMGFESEVTQYAKKWGGSKLGAFMEALGKLNSNLLEGEDWIFLNKNYVRALSQYIAANGWDLNTLTTSESTIYKQRLADARSYATQEALKATYRDANALASFLSQQEKNNPVAGLLISGLVPFKKTPLNILKRGVEYSPIGLISGITKAFTMVGKTIGTGANRHEVTINECLDNICSGLTGSAVMAIGYFLAGLGIVKGGGSDSDREEYYDEMLGNQPYSITIGDTNYTLDWATPISMPLFGGVELYESMNNSDEVTAESTFNAMLNALSSSADPLTSLSLLSGINDALSSYEDNKIGAFVESAATNYVSQFVPTIGGQIARTLDTTRRTTYAPSDTDTLFGQEGAQLVNSLKNKIPGLSSTNEPYIDMWGNTEERESDAGILGVFFNQSVNPGYTKKVNVTAADNIVTPVFEATGDSTTLPSTPKSKQTIGDVTVTLDAAEYTQFKQIAGQTKYQAVVSAGQSDLWEGLDDSVKAEVLNAIYDYSNTVAKADYAETNNIKYDTTAAKEQNYVQAALNSGLSLGEYFIIKTVMNNFDSKNSNGKTVEGLKTKRQKNYASAIGLSYKQYQIVTKKVDL